MGHIRYPQNTEHKTQSGGHDKQNHGPAQTNQKVDAQDGQGYTLPNFHTVNSFQRLQVPTCPPLLSLWWNRQGYRGDEENLRSSAPKAERLTCIQSLKSILPKTSSKFTDPPAPLNETGGRLKGERPFIGHVPP